MNSQKSQDKKTYTEPTLNTLGNVRELTQIIAPPDGSGPPVLQTT